MRDAVLLFIVLCLWAQCNQHQQIHQHLDRIEAQCKGHDG